MTNHALLDNVSHKDLRINKQYREGCGFDVNVARVFPIELGSLQAEYPLLFARDAESGQFSTVALLGFSKGENLYLKDGRWGAVAMPLTIERQPFLIGFQERMVDGAPSREPVVTIDLDHPSVNDTEGEKLFLEHGGETPYLERVSSVLQAIHEGHDASRTFSELLVGLELIESLVMDIEFIDGSHHSLQGLFAVNEDRLRELDGGALETLHRQGHLQNVYMMLASLPKLSVLIDEKNRRLAAGS